MECDTYLCISLAPLLMPRHSNSIKPAMAMDTRKRVLVKKTHIALVGGNWDLADFQVMPPLGRSMASERSTGGRRHHPENRVWEKEGCESGGDRR